MNKGGRWKTKILFFMGYIKGTMRMQWGGGVGVGLGVGR